MATAIAKRTSANVVSVTGTAKQRKIYSVLQSVDTLPKTSVKNPNLDYSKIVIQNQYGYVPDFVFEWCSVNEHYRLYIYVASREHDKERAGYSIMNIGSKLAAVAFCAFYNAIHRYRANTKE